MSPQEILLAAYGMHGGVRPTGTEAHVGNFRSIFAITDAVVGGGTVGNVSNISGATISAGHSVFGKFSACSVSSGQAIFYHGS